MHMVVLIIGALVCYIGLKLVIALIRYLIDRKKGGDGTATQSACHAPESHPAKPEN